LFELRWSGRGTVRRRWKGKEEEEDWIGEQAARRRRHGEEWQED